MDQKLQIICMIISVLVREFLIFSRGPHCQTLISMILDWNCEIDIIFLQNINYIIYIRHEKTIMFSFSNEIAIIFSLNYENNWQFKWMSTVIIHEFWFSLGSGLTASNARIFFTIFCCCSIDWNKQWCAECSFLTKENTLWSQHKTWMSLYYCSLSGIPL